MKDCFSCYAKPYSFEGVETPLGALPVNFMGLWVAPIPPTYRNCFISRLWHLFFFLIPILRPVVKGIDVQELVFRYSFELDVVFIMSFSTPLTVDDC